MLIRRATGGNPPLSPQTQYKRRIGLMSETLHDTKLRCRHLELNLKAASTARKLAESKLALSESRRAFVEKDNERLRKLIYELESKHSRVQSIVETTIRDLIHLQAGL